MSWFIRKATPEDKKDIISFFKSYIWASRDGEKLYSWKFEDNPCGSALIWLAIDEKTGRIVGTRVKMPWRMRVCENIVTVAQAVDGLVDKDYRRQGIHIAMGRQILSELSQMGIPFVFAFPNQNSLPSLLKAGWHQVGFVRRWVKPFKAEYILSKFIGRNVISKFLGFFMDAWLRLVSRERFYRSSTKFVIKEIEKFDERFDILWERVSKNFKVIGVRDNKYLNWKYINVPNKKYVAFSVEKDNVLAGYIVLEFGDRIGYIIDVFTEQDDEVINYLIAYTVQYLKCQNILAVNFKALDMNPFLKYFEKFGFHLRPDKSSFMVRINSNSANQDIMLNRKNWFITIGDNDMVHTFLS